MVKKILSLFSDSAGSFEGQEEGEKIILLLRHHPFNIFSKIVVFAFLCFVPIVLGSIFFEYLNVHNLVAVFVTISSLWYMALWILIFYALTMYSLNILIVTDRRIIENEQRSLFDRKIAGIHIARVQDVSVHTQGVIETFLSFGNIVIQSAGSEKHFSFANIANPEKVKNIIMKLVSDTQSFTPQA
jgi:hypothetical protein